MFSLTTMRQLGPRPAPPDLADDITSIENHFVPHSAGETSACGASWSGLLLTPPLLPKPLRQHLEKRAALHRLPQTHLVSQNACFSTPSLNAERKMCHDTRPRWAQNACSQHMMRTAWPDARPANPFKKVKSKNYSRFSGATQQPTTRRRGAGEVRALSTWPPGCASVELWFAEAMGNAVSFDAPSPTATHGRESRRKPCWQVSNNLRLTVACHDE